MPFHKQIQTVLGRISLQVPLKLLINISRQYLILPFYHTVSDVYLPHVSPLYMPKTIREFECDLDFFLKYFEPVDLNYLSGCINIKARPAMFLSFDDGLKEIATIIAPILKRKGVPATFFINPLFIDNNDLFFRYKIAIIADRLKKTVTLSQEQKIQQILRISSKDNLIDRHIFKLKYHHQQIIESIAEILAIDFTEYLQNHRPYLKSEEIRQLQHDGFSIGAHSMDHPELRYLPLKDQLKQAQDSVLFLKKMLKPDIMSFSFPFTDFGVENSFFEQFRAMDICNFTFGTAGLKHDPIPNHFQRIPMENGFKTAEQTIKYEYIYFLLKLLAGKNTIYRK